MSNARPVMAFRPKRTKQPVDGTRNLRKSPCEHTQLAEQVAKESYVNELVELADEMDGSLMLDQSGYLSGTVLGSTRIANQTQRLDQSEHSIHGWSGQIRTTSQSNQNQGQMLINQLKNPVSASGYQSSKYHGDSKSRVKQSDEEANIFRSTNNFFLAAHPHLNKGGYSQKLLSWFSTSTNSSDPRGAENIGSAPDESKIRPRLMFNQKSKQITRSTIFGGKEYKDEYLSGEPASDPAEPLSVRKVLSNSTSRRSFAIGNLMTLQDLGRCDVAKDPTPPTIGFLQNQRGYISLTNFRKKSASRIDSRMEMRTGHECLVQTNPKSKLIHLSSQKLHESAQIKKSRSADLTFEFDEKHRKFGSQDPSFNQYLQKPQPGMHDRRLVSGKTKNNSSKPGELKITLNNFHLVPTGTRLNSSSSLSRYRIQQKPTKLPTKPGGQLYPSGHLSFEVRVPSACRPPASMVSHSRTAAHEEVRLSRSHSVGWLQPSLSRQYF